MDTLTTQIDQLEAQIATLQQAAHLILYHHPALAAAPHTGLTGFPRVLAYLVEQEDKRAQNDPDADLDLFDRLYALERAFEEMGDRTDRLRKKVTYLSSTCYQLLKQVELASRNPPDDQSAIQNP